MGLSSVWLVTAAAQELPRVPTEMGFAWVDFV